VNEPRGAVRQSSPRFPASKVLSRGLVSRGRDGAAPAPQAEPAARQKATTGSSATGGSGRHTQAARCLAAGAELKTEKDHGRTARDVRPKPRKRKLNDHSTAALQIATPTVPGEW